MTWKTLVQFIDVDTGQLLYDLREFQEIVNLRETKTVQITFNQYEKRIFKFYRRKDGLQQTLF